MNQAPFFPGYIFVQANLHKIPPSRINTCPGVLSLVTFGEEPQSVPHHVIEEISERLKHIEVLNTQSFRSGEVVRMKQGGSLQYLEMIFVGPLTASLRVQVLLNFLGRLKGIQVDTGAIERATMYGMKVRGDNVDGAYPQRRRYTRGKGRKIKNFSENRSL